MASSVAININTLNSAIDARNSSSSNTKTNGISPSLVIQHNPKYEEEIPKSKKSKKMNNTTFNQKVKIEDNRSTEVSNEEIIDQAGDVLKASASVANSLGAEGAADTLNKAGDLAKSIPVAVQGVKKEIEPVKSAGKKFWKSLEDRGIVGRKDKVNLKGMHKK